MSPQPGIERVVTHGTMLDPHALIAEIARIGEQGVTVTPDNLRIADNAALILSVHRELDQAREALEMIDERRATGKVVLNPRA